MSVQADKRTPDAVEAEAQAAAWLERRDRADWTSELQAQLETWLVESPAHRLAYLRLYAAWNYADRLVVMRRPRLSRLVSSSRKIGPATFKIAAACTVVAAIGVAGVSYSKKPQTQAFETPVGGHETLKLADGSRIELNTNTKVRVALSAGQRKVWLDKGEAYFEIQHNEARPFTVITGNHRITDLGTKFAVRANGDSLRVALLEGRAKVDTDSVWSQPQSVILTPGDVVVATRSSLSMERHPSHLLNEELGWRRGMLIFDRTPLADVVAQFNRYNAKKLSVSGAAAQMKIDGTFPADNIDDFLHLARAVLGLKIERQADVVMLSRNAQRENH
ncbi:MAG TPA: FecR domain-containing protein [Rhizomicrobium sp.]|jgi:transmembrane sensor|nr:FecR domain-containing protein [Rhizomicrobium sp.]